MPQLNTAIYFHEYGWLFFSFFFSYFIFLKYYLPYLIHWVKITQRSSMYYLNFLIIINGLILSTSNYKTTSNFYKLLLSTSLIGKLDYVYEKNVQQMLNHSKIERTIYNLYIKYKK